MSLVAYVEIYALFRGEQTDPKRACGGPNSFLRTGGVGGWDIYQILVIFVDLLIFCFMFLLTFRLKHC